MSGRQVFRTGSIHIDDGKCVAVNPEGKFVQPIPWDPKCFLNATTSICDSDALGSFRHFYSEKLPVAVFVGSDGVDDCFSNNDQLHNLYKTILYSFGTSPFQEAVDGLSEYLPRLSAKGSGDDVSISAMMDLDLLPELSIVKECLEIGVSVRCHLEDITRADIYGYVIPFCLELMKLRQQYGIPVKVRCCDTMGYGVNYPGAVIPRSVPGIIYGIMVHAGVPSELIEWHGHNDFYKAVSNSTTAWLYGACGVNTSLFGIGERTGNTPLEAMVFEYAQLRGNLGGMDTTVITELAEYYEKEIGYHIPERTPFVGKNFNVTRAGIHADGLLKNEEIYNVFDTEKFLNRPVEVAVSNTSGAAGIAHWIDSHYRLKGDQKVDKNSELVKLIKSWVDQQYEDGRVTVLCDTELEAIVAETCQRLGITLK